MWLLNIMEDGDIFCGQPCTSYINRSQFTIYFHQIRTFTLPWNNNCVYFNPEYEKVPIICEEFWLEKYCILVSSLLISKYRILRSNFVSNKVISLFSSNFILQCTAQLFLLICNSPMQVFLIKSWCSDPKIARKVRLVNGTKMKLTKRSIVAWITIKFTVLF